MREYILDGAAMISRSGAHSELQRALELPEHYGRNLDALWDCITGMHAGVTLINPAPMLNALGVYGCKLVQTLFEAMEANENFSFRIAE